MSPSTLCAVAGAILAVGGILGSIAVRRDPRARGAAVAIVMLLGGIVLIQVSATIQRRETRQEVRDFCDTAVSLAHQRGLERETLPGGLPGPPPCPDCGGLNTASTYDRTGIRHVGVDCGKERFVKREVKP